MIAAFRQDHGVRGSRRPFETALGLYMVGSAMGLALALVDDSNDKGTVAGAFVFGAVLMAILWFFDGRGHRWPRWTLLFLLIIAIGAQAAFGDLRSLLAVLDLVALVVLVRGWTQQPA